MDDTQGGVTPALAVWYGDPACRIATAVVERTKGGAAEAQDVYGTCLRLTREGLAYGEEFVAFDELDDTRTASHSLWNSATNLFEVSVARRHGPPLVVKNLPPRTADRLRRAITDALHERRL